MTMNLSEQIAHKCLQWQECIRDGREYEAAELKAEIEHLGDRIGLMARQRNEAVQEMGVS